MRILSLALFACLCTPALAADHPWVGVFYVSPTKLDPGQYEQARRNCAWSFAIQNADGTGTAFLLNRAKADATAKPAYEKWISTACDYVESTRQDSCKLTGSPPGPAAAPPQTGTIYDSASPELVEMRFFEDPAKAEEAARSNDTAAGYPMTAVRCPFTAQQIAPFLTDQYTQLTIETWSPLMVPKGTPEDNAHMDKMLAAIGVSAAQK